VDMNAICAKCPNRAQYRIFSDPQIPGRNDVNLASVFGFAWTWRRFGQGVFDENVVARERITVKLLQILYTQVPVGHSISGSDRLPLAMMPDAGIDIQEVAHTSVVDVKDQPSSLCFAQ